MNARRQAGGYAWRDELEGIRRHCDDVANGLTELSKHARTVEVSNLITRLVVSNSQIALAVMDLRDYKS